MSDPVVLTEFDATGFLPATGHDCVKRPVILRLSDHTYGPGDSLETSWLPFAFDAFSWVSKQTAPRDILILGTGNGLDALGAIELMHPVTVTVTDLQQEVVDLALDNIRRHIRPDMGIECVGYVSNLFEHVLPSKRFSLIYENLPNLPADNLVNVYDGTNSASYFDGDHQHVPAEFKDLLLASHYLCLQSAKSRLAPRGGILTTIGGRVPLQMIFQLHRSAKLRPELAAFGFKIQSEAEIVIPGYANACRKGSDFRFYRQDVMADWKAVRELKLDPMESYERFMPKAQQYALTCQEALELQKQGIPVAHAVFVVHGSV